MEAMTQTVRSSPLALTVLGMLHTRPLHPYGIQRLIKQWGKDQVVNVGQRTALYRTIERLEEGGLVAVRGTGRDQQYPERTVYEITDAGATEMTDWLTELIGTPAREYPAFMAGLSFLPALDPDDALAALRRRAEMLTVKLASLRGVEKAARDAGLPRIFALESEYEEGQLVAELKFVTALADEMQNGTLEGLDMWRLFQTEDFDPEEVHFTFELPKE